MEQQVRSVSDMFKQISNVNFTECSMTNYHIEQQTPMLSYSQLYIAWLGVGMVEPHLYVAAQCPIDRPLYLLDETM